jgi:Transposase DDE domain
MLGGANGHPQEQEVFMTSFAAALERIKGDVRQAVPAHLITRATNALGILSRNRLLTPAVTTHLALYRALHGGTAITHLRHLAEMSFTPSAYCQAIARLPETFFRLLQILVTDRLRHDRPQDRWLGHRLFLIDGTGVSMPDTPDLQAAFGQPGGQKLGCGFPVAHLLVLFEARSGYLLKTLVAPLRTHDLTHAAALHPEMQAGDVLVGDRAFASFAHLALCLRRGLHAVFRAHQRRRHTTAPDRLVRYAQPSRRPSWMTAEEYDALPGEVLVREIRVRVRTPGRRLRTLVLVTTLLDRRRYPARAIARVYEQRWRVETNLAHLKTTLGMDILKSRTAEGVRKEILVFGLAYNLVRRVMRAAADRQGVEWDRVSFVDALRWLRQAKAEEELPRLVVHPRRPGRFDPRVKKRRPKPYPRMTRPRGELKKELRKKQLVT